MARANLMPNHFDGAEQIAYQIISITLPTGGVG